MNNIRGYDWEIQGKNIYREACDDKVGWNAEVSQKTAKDWVK